jgi:lipopolysaccharide export LptBFGC system permease protein LptF
MAPVVALLSTQKSGLVKIVIVLIFTLFFSAALSLFTKATRQEVFAATAAYCAVLVVFLGNFVQS